MKAFLVLISFCIFFQLSGCASAVKNLSKNPDGTFSAEALNINEDDLIKAQSISNKKELLGRIVYDSVKKCQDFLNGLIAGQKSINVTGDILTTALSGIATAVTPVNTIHILTAGATLVSGTKAALNADLYGKASSANLQTALQGTYSKYINNYLTELSLVNDGNLIVSVEASKIQTIHATCSIAAAEASISATITPSAEDKKQEDNKKAQTPPAAQAPAPPVAQAPPPPAQAPAPSGGSNVTHGVTFGAPIR